MSEYIESNVLNKKDQKKTGYGNHSNISIKENAAISNIARAGQNI